ncbi:MAG: sigma 54-dependent Fis family transcriptional regulator [Deltaproteobacteria bacterium]|nr:sigma 54-dependent Fis family transcriptional regulator [Deltaproteobacteria bacterium]
MPEADDLTTGTWTAQSPGAGDVVHVRACRFEIVAGPDAGLARTFAAPTLRIGRAGTDLVLSDRKVSTLHFEIALEEQGYRVRDLGSTNGTFVQGVRVLDGFVQPGALITLGDTTIRFAPEARSVELPLWPESRFESLVGTSTAMRRLFAEIDRIAGTDATVLVTGETGVGKELVAEAVHARSTRADGPFVVLDCGAVPRQLFEDQLFGHEAGAFTGAHKASAGVFELAEGGTVFLDEIGELPLDLQTRLLRVVESRQVRRIGGTRPIDCDVRIVAATHRDLAAEVNRGAFRSDLYYRIAVVHLTVAPLRDRMQDLPVLATHLLAQLGPSAPTSLPVEFLDWASKHGWPGNVRQLRNAIARAVALGDWSARTNVVAKGASPSAPSLDIDLSVPFRDAKQRLVDEFDRRYITALLDAHRGNVSAAARAAGIDRMSIYKAIQRLGLDPRAE